MGKLDQLLLQGMIVFILQICLLRQDKKWNKKLENYGFMWKSMGIGDGKYKVDSKGLRNTLGIIPNKQ